MKATLLFAFFALILFVEANGQQIPLNSLSENESIVNAALLPDSSLMIASENGEISTVKRFVYLNGQWRDAPDQLTNIVNGLSTRHKHFRFSTDFDQILIIAFEGNQERCYQISRSSEGQWGLPVEILKSLRGEFNHQTPSLSADGNKIFSTAYGLAANQIIIHQVRDEKLLPSTTIDEFDRILNVLPLAQSSLLVKAVKKGEKLSNYFYIQMRADQQYTAPLIINELLPAQTAGPIEVSLTPFPGWVLCKKEESGALELVKLSDRVAETWKERSAEMPMPQLAVAKKEESKYVNPNGRYHALLIGNNQYEQKQLNLINPVADALKLKEILVNRYTFDEEQVHVITNASRSDILSELYNLRQSLSKEDNLLIFYAGHGFWDKDVQQGYWWPTDANPKNPSNWLSNSDLKEQIRGIGSAHTLLISDACFSGGIFKTRGVEDLRDAGTNIQLLYRMPSRRAISSGTLSTVPDNSVFFKYLSKYLEENEEKYLPSTELFTKLRKSVLNNSLTVPQDGVIRDAGDEGGDFIFIKR